MITILEYRKSIDGSTKYLFECEKDEIFEALYFYPDNMLKSSICISTQIGCAVKCSFCQTGTLGFKRNLTCYEMTDTINLILENEHKLGKNTENLDTIALMGMGEPLHNYFEVKKFYHLANKFFNVKHISLSTSGVAENIIRLANDDTNYLLLLSLHSPFDEERSSLIPLNKCYSISETISACEYYYTTKQQHSLNTKVRASYLLLKDYNDSEIHAKELAKILNKDIFKIQILLYNETSISLFKRPTLQDARIFENILKKYGFDTKISISRGQDIGGGCGQMAGKKGENNVC